MKVPFPPAGVTAVSRTEVGPARYTQPRHAEAEAGMIDSIWSHVSKQGCD